MGVTPLGETTESAKAATHIGELVGNYTVSQ